MSESNIKKAAAQAAYAGGEKIPLSAKTAVELHALFVLASNSQAESARHGENYISKLMSILDAKDIAADRDVIANGGVQINFGDRWMIVAKVQEEPEEQPVQE